MTEKTKNYGDRIRLTKRILGAVTSVLTVAEGICLAAACLVIYRSGEAPFTRESISAAFASVALPTLLALAAVAASAVLGVLFPSEAVRIRAERDDARALRGLYRKFALLAQGEPSDNAKAIISERKKRRLICAVAAVVCGLCLAVTLPTVLDTDRYTLEALNGNAVIIETVTLAAVATAIALAACIAASVLTAKSRSRELEAFKAAIVAKDPSIVKNDGAAAEVGGLYRRTAVWVKSHGRGLKLSLRISVFLIGVLMVVLGVLNGSMNDVLQKAIRICTECIGLG